MIDKEFIAIIKRIKARQAAMPVLTNEEWEKKAIQYARWLAERDNIEIPTYRPWGESARAIWSGVPHKTKARNGRPVMERRICSVEWGETKDVYNTRKDGRRGAFSHKEWTTESTVDLPNWDWQPEVIDTSESDDCLAMAA